MNPHIYVICEGKSEYAYIQEVNRLLQREGAHGCLVPKDAHGGAPLQIKGVYDSLGTINAPLYTWLDSDIYTSDRRRYTLTDQQIEKYHVQFTHWNFEDFLAMHGDHDATEHWIHVCERNGHWQHPLGGREIELLLREEMYNDYRKGSLPKAILPLTPEKLERVVRNLREVEVAHCQCPMAEILWHIVQERLA